MSADYLQPGNRKISMEFFEEGVRGASVLVVGDLMLDRYLFGEAARISQEAPVLVMRHRRQNENPGGAGNVACNLAALGLAVNVIGVVGTDADGDRLLGLLSAVGINSDLVHARRARPTTTKCRVVSGRHQLLRLDVEETDDFQLDLVQILKNSVQQTRLAEPKAIVLSDYAKGVVTFEIAQAAISIGKQLGIPVVVDPKGPNWAKYHGATMASPNRIELIEATGFSAHDLEGLLAAGEALRQKLDFDFLAVTLGELGIALLDEHGMHRLPSEAREVFDVSGAGDTVIAAIAAALIARINRREALQLANIAAGIVVGRAGTVPIDREAFREAVAQFGGHGHRHKICDAKQATRRAETWRRLGQKVVFTNGCFDLVHAGHALHLEEARSFGNRLILGLNSDLSIRGLKGNSCPIQNQQDRAILLASLASVDAVVIFDESTPLQLVVEIRPDVMIKGNDYAKENIAGAAEVESWGGQVITLPLVEGRSTSAIIERIRQSQALQD